MTTRRIPIILSALVAVLLSSVPASAGNWATARLDASAAMPIAGLEATFGFEIRQHGVTPVDWVTATFVATNLTTRAQIQSPMHPDGTVGHYVTTITFPEAGDWTWYVLLRELGTDQDGAGGTLPVVTPVEAAASILAELRRGVGPAMDLAATMGLWRGAGLATAARTD
jgi:hypothetical protein